MDGSTPIQECAEIVGLSYLRKREDMKLCGDHREEQEEMERGARVGYSENTLSTCTKFSKNIFKQNKTIDLYSFCILNYTSTVIICLNSKSFNYMAELEV